jgi:hypothetical protein
LQRSVPTDQEFPIGSLIARRQAEFISTGELERRAGYKSTNGGLRRLADLCQGDLSPKTQFLLDALPHALDLKAAQVQTAIRATMEQIEEAQRAQAEAEERAYRRSFVPHLIIVPKRDRPSPLVVVALIGAEKILRRDFDLTRGPDTFVDQALAIVPTRVAAGGRRPASPSISRPTMPSSSIGKGMRSRVSPRQCALERPT